MCISEGKKKKVKNTAGLKKEVKIFSEQEFDYKNVGYCVKKKKRLIDEYFKQGGGG